MKDDMPIEDNEVHDEEKSLSLWLWIVPLLLVIAFAIYFVRKHAPAPLPVSDRASSLPALGAVHYETSRATLDPDGIATIDRAAESLRGNPNVGLRLEGYPDQPGVSLHNDLLTQQRTAAVRGELESRGIDPNRLVVAPFPPPTPADTDPNPDKAPDTRRIELYLR